MAKDRSREKLILIDYAILLAQKFQRFIGSHDLKLRNKRNKISIKRVFSVTQHPVSMIVRSVRDFFPFSIKLSYEEKKLVLLLLGISLLEKNGLLIWQVANFFHRSPVKCLEFVQTVLDPSHQLLSKKIVFSEENDFSQQTLPLIHMANLYNIKRIFLSPIAFTKIFHEIGGGNGYGFPTLNMSSGRYANVDGMLNDLNEIIKYHFFISGFFHNVYSWGVSPDSNIYDDGDFAQSLKAFRKKIVSSKLSMELADFLKARKLTSLEFFFLIYLIYRVIIQKETKFNSIEEILSLLSFSPSHTKTILRFFLKDSVFVNEGLIEANDFFETNSLIEEEDLDEFDDMVDQDLYDEISFEMSTISISRERIYKMIFADVKAEKDKIKNKAEASNSLADGERNTDKNRFRGLYEIYTPQVTLNSVILDEDVKKNLMGAVDMTRTIETMREWGIKPSLSSTSYSSIKILLYGTSGTGKTITSEALAGEAGAELFKVDASNMVTSWVGESAKNVKKIFKEFYRYAQQSTKKVFMFFNEADQLLSARGAVMQAADKEYNQMQNILLEELENFDGVFIATTNLIDIFDTAWNRRFNIKIKFDIPTMETRLKLWEVHISNKLPLAEDVDLKKLAETELAGGSIANVVYNAARKAALRDEGSRVVTQQDFMEAIKQELTSRIGGLKNKVGFSS
ncbi:MAG: ATP-binding protein [Brevinematales bacterium]|nr:ATP-binding protein [Brevinematales bacterium]